MAHLYDTKLIVVNGREVAVVLSWKGEERHLKVEMGDWWHDGTMRPGVWVSADVMWADLDEYFRVMEAELLSNPEMARSLRERIPALGRQLGNQVRPEGSAAIAWETFLSERLQPAVS